MSASLYLLLRGVHLTCVALSFGGFLLRGMWMLQDSPRLRSRWVRVVPHLVDTLLLASAVGLATLLSLKPWEQPWLAAKLLALLGYIGAGSVALRHGRTRAQRAGAFALAVLLFLYIVAVALTRSPWPPGG